MKYDATETNYLLQVLDCSLSDIMLGRIEEPFYQVQVEQSINSDSGNKRYSIHLLNEGKEHFLAFEEESARFELTSKSVINKQQVQEYVDELFAAGYFDVARTGFEVFRLCIERFGLSLKPSFVADALGFYTGKRKVPRLVKGKNENSREVFLAENKSII